MQQLTGLDTTFLNIETPTTYGHIASLAIFDPSTGAAPATIDDIRALLEERMHLLAPYRRRLVEVPFGIDHPYWIEDPDFDLDFHLRHIGLPPPGNSTKLTELVERIVARPLDRRKPLWELYVIEGLENGYVAQLSKIHHSAIDGVGGAEIMASLLDISPEPRVVDPPEVPWKPDNEPSELEMFGRGMLSVARSPARGVEAVGRHDPQRSGDCEEHGNRRRRTLRVIGGIRQTRPDAFAGSNEAAQNFVQRSHWSSTAGLPTPRSLSPR